MNFRLLKSERLHSQKLIKELFDRSSSFFLYPFKVLYLEGEETNGDCPQVLFSVSKRKINKAVSRNLMKRRMREAYRINKHLLSESSSQLFIGLIYVSSDIMEFKQVEEKIKLILHRIIKEQKNENE